MYALLTKGEAYISQAMEDDEQAYQARKFEGLRRHAQSLGDRLEPLPVE